MRQYTQDMVYPVLKPRPDPDFPDLPAEDDGCRFPKAGGPGVVPVYGVGAALALCSCAALAAIRKRKDEDE